MSRLGALRRRLKTLQTISKMTSAMKMVAASRLRQGQGLLSFSEDFYKGHAFLWDRAALFTEEVRLELLPFLERGERTPRLLLLTSDRGLCGGFNTSLIRYFRQQNLSACDWAVVGHKGFNLLKSDPGSPWIQEEVPLMHLDSPKACYDFLKPVFDSPGPLLWIRPRLRTHFSFDPVIEEILPLPLPSEPHWQLWESDDLASTLIQFIKEYLSARLYHAVIETRVCESIARMLAMDQSSRNAQEMIRKIQLIYNRTRQSQITRELIEMLSGVEALSREH